MAELLRYALIWKSARRDCPAHSIREGHSDSPANETSYGCGALLDANDIDGDCGDVVGATYRQRRGPCGGGWRLTRRNGNGYMFEDVEHIFELA